MLMAACAIAAVPVAGGEPPPGLIRSDPVVCTGNRDLVVENRYIESTGNGVELRGNCDVLIRNSHIVAGGYGVLVASNGDVNIVDSFIEGGQAALRVAGNGEILYRGCTVRGRIETVGYGEIIDGGGNIREAHGGAVPESRGRGSTDAGHVDTSVVVGPDSVKVRSGDTQVVATDDGWRVETGTAGNYDTERVLVELGATMHDDRMQLQLAGDVLFDFDSAAIRSDAAARLAKVAHVVRVRSSGEVRIVGHTDSIGSDAYNQRLSEQRASAVKQWLNEKEGIPAHLMLVQGMGSRKPVAYNTMPDGSDNPDGRAQNRRVEVSFAAIGEVVASSAGSAVTIGPQGVRVAGAGGEVTVGAEGVQVSGDGARVAAEADRVEATVRHVDETPSTCQRVCKAWPSFNDLQIGCVTAALHLRGYEVYDNLLCIGVETKAGCLACRAALGLSEDDCTAVVNACLQSQ
jgi:outer membrane protein OmpA-like peptidoglycan-associated protein